MTNLYLGGDDPTGFRETLDHGDKEEEASVEVAHQENRQNHIDDLQVHTVGGLHLHYSREKFHYGTQTIVNSPHRVKYLRKVTAIHQSADPLKRFSEV